MAFWDRFRKRTRAEPEEPEERPIATGRVSSTGSRYGRKYFSPFRPRVGDTLETLRHIYEESEALKYLKRVNPDVSMGIWNFVRLANQGHEMAFYAPGTENRMPDIEAEWRGFSARVNQISNAGMDGLVDVLHQSAYTLGAQGAEVEVNDTRDDVVDVHPIIPQTIEWELEERNGRQTWIPYQQQFPQKVSLEPGKANFYWVPTDPDIDDPRGNLILAPVLQSVDFQMQIMQDLQAILHHQGFPRNDIKILMERMMAAMPAEARNSVVKQREWLKARYDEIVSMLDNLDPDSDYIHFDEVEIGMTQGFSGNRSVDVRAIMEMVDTQTLSGAKQLSIFMNRNTGVTESWGTVQFRIFCSGIASIQRGSKRIIEEIARLWLRVRGYQAVPVFTHNQIDWNSEEQRMTVKLMEEEFHAIAQLMGWQLGDEAAGAVLGKEKAAGEPTESARVSFGRGGDLTATDEHGEGGLRQEHVKKGLRSRLGVVR